MTRGIALFISIAALLWTSAGTQRAFASDSRVRCIENALAGMPADDVPNLHRVATNLYRSGQPSPRGFEVLAKCGIRTAINLRAVGRDEFVIEGLALRVRLARFPLHAWGIQSEYPTVVAALRALRKATHHGPTLVHCEQGSDRTGAIVALYRITYESWKTEKALREMEERLYGFNFIWMNIPAFINGLDPAQLRRDVGPG